MSERVVLASLSVQAATAAINAGESGDAVRHYLAIAIAAVAELPASEAPVFRRKLRALAASVGEPEPQYVERTAQRLCIATLRTSTAPMQVAHVVASGGNALDVRHAGPGFFEIWATPAMDAHPYASAVALFVELDAHLRGAFDDSQLDQFLLTPHLL